MALQARLADLKREREAVVKRLERIGPPHPANAAASNMRRCVRVECLSVCLCVLGTLAFGPKLIKCARVYGVGPVRPVVTLNRHPPHNPQPTHSGPAPEGRRDGGLLARLGGKRGRDDDNDGGGGNGRRGRSRSRSRSRGRGRDRDREGEEGGPPRSRRRLASAVGAPDAGVAAGTWEEVGGWVCRKRGGGEMR